MERANGIEPSTLTLARLCSTAELRPHIHMLWYLGSESNRHGQSPPDFESSVSTNSTTEASTYKR